jgi:hypothetical protein
VHGNLGLVLGRDDPVIAWMRNNAAMVNTIHADLVEAEKRSSCFAKFVYFCII